MQVERVRRYAQDKVRRHACGGERVKETCRRCGRQARGEAGMAGREQEGV